VRERIRSLRPLRGDDALEQLHRTDLEDRCQAEEEGEAHAVRPIFDGLEDSRLNGHRLSELLLRKAQALSANPDVVSEGLLMSGAQPVPHGYAHT
jgi:hypothetical protein